MAANEPGPDGWRRDARESEAGDGGSLVGPAAASRQTTSYPAPDGNAAEEHGVP
jgi:hypothetical protein